MQKQNDNKMNLYFVFVFVLEKISKTEHMAKFWREKH